MTTDAVNMLFPNCFTRICVGNKLESQPLDCSMHADTCLLCCHLSCQVMNKCITCSWVTVTWAWGVINLVLAGGFTAIDHSTFKQFCCYDRFSTTTAKDLRWYIMISVKLDDDEHLLYAALAHTHWVSSHHQREVHAKLRLVSVSIMNALYCRIQIAPKCLWNIVAIVVSCEWPLVMITQTTGVVHLYHVHAVIHTQPSIK